MKLKYALPIVVPILVIAFCGASAPTHAGEQKTQIEIAVAKEIERLQVIKEEVADKQILSKYFGAGVMANFDVNRGGRDRRVKSARTVGGVVRVEEESKSQVGFVLEAHKFWSTPPNETYPFVHGPFLGLVMDQSTIDTAVLGYMWGFRQPSSTQTLNLGIGASVTPRAQVLGDGINEGEALPNGETEVRYKYKTKFGLAVMVSFGF